jgi:cytochrome c oxidase assembly protein subunit 11
MKVKKNNNLIPYLILGVLLIFILFIYFSINEVQKKKNQALALEPIKINLLTSVHPNLDWIFKPIKSKITVKPGEVTTVEYIVENLSEKESTGIATFVYFPNEFGNYISKLNCFCYDAQTLNAKEKNKYTLVLLIDPEVTKDSKTKSVKEATIQFTFFDYKQHQENKS